MHCRRQERLAAAELAAEQQAAVAAVQRDIKRQLLQEQKSDVETAVARCGATRLHTWAHITGSCGPGC
jgi:hypothetical protein